MGCLCSMRYGLPVFVSKVPLPKQAPGMLAAGDSSSPDMPRPNDRSMPLFAHSMLDSIDAFLHVERPLPVAFGAPFCALYEATGLPRLVIDALLAEFEDSNRTCCIVAERLSDRQQSQLQKAAEARGYQLCAPTLCRQPHASMLHKRVLPAQICFAAQV